MARRHSSALALLCALTACGAKTGLRAPCEIALARERAAIMVIVARSASTTVETPAGERLFDVQRRMVGELLAPLDRVADVGAVLNTPPRFGAQDCAAPLPVAVPLAAGTTARVLGAIDDSVRDIRPLLASALRPAFRAAVGAFALSTPDDRRVVLLFNLGNYCSPDAYDVPDEVAAAPARTAVVWLSGLVPGVGGSFEDMSARLASAGRVPNPANPRGFYRIEDATVLRETFERAVVRPYFCELRPERPLDSERGWVLRTAGGAIVEPDGPGSPAWSLSPATGRVELHGTTCAEAMRAEHSPTLVERGYSCGW